MTSVLRICEQGGAPLAVLLSPLLPQVMRASVWAMVSPALANRLGLVFGNGWPVVGAPGLTATVRPERPCEGLLTLAVPATWQPLQVLVSPGSSCSQLVCVAVTRLAFTSTMSMVNGTSAGTCTWTEPSGWMGA